MNRGAELSFVGPATFFKAPYRPLEPGAGEGEVYDVALLGVPYDFAVGYRPGARFAPAAVRAASGRLAPPTEGLYDPVSGRRRLAGIELLDAGDVDLLQLDTEGSFERISGAALSLRRRARLPIFVGGDHSISYPLLRSFRDETAMHIVQFDAHLDFSDARNGTRLSNSSPFRRAFEELPGLTGRTVIGLRGMRADEEALRASRSRGHELVLADTVHDSFEEALARLPSGERVYLSFDVDVLDPAELPGTSSPEPGGLGFRQVRRLLEALCGRNELVGVDLTELAPDLDQSGRSQLLAARLLAEVVAFWWDGRTHAAG